MNKYSRLWSERAHVRSGEMGRGKRSIFKRLNSGLNHSLEVSHVFRVVLDSSPMQDLRTGLDPGPLWTLDNTIAWSYPSVLSGPSSCPAGNVWVWSRCLGLQSVEFHPTNQRAREAGVVVRCG
ncbi:unnamed protein product [Knipowitschia caucasica]